MPSSVMAPAAIRLTGGASTPAPPITLLVDGSSSLSLTEMSEALSSLEMPPAWRARVSAPSSSPPRLVSTDCSPRVYYIPALRNSIIRLGQLDESGSRVEIKDGVMRIWDRYHCLLAKVTRGTNRLYVLNVWVAQPLCLAARWDDEAWQWHERFGHLHFEALKRLSAKGMVRGLTSLDHVEQFYDVCVLTKQRRLPFSQQSSF
jgi:hypothetical protein